MDVVDQVVSVYAGTQGFLDDLPVTAVRRFEQELAAAMHAGHAALLDTIRTTGRLDEAGMQQLKDAIAAFKATFKA
jgi:F-type H+-transporting ATPase subunit alpha